MRTSGSKETPCRDQTTYLFHLFIGTHGGFLPRKRASVQEEGLAKFLPFFTFFQTPSIPPVRGRSQRWRTSNVSIPVAASSDLHPRRHGTNQYYSKGRGMCVCGGGTGGSPFFKAAPHVTSTNGILLRLRFFLPRSNDSALGLCHLHHYN